VTVTATSKTDPSKTGTAAVTLTPISVNPVSPATISVGTGASQAFTVSVANDGSNSGVTWSIGSGVGTLTGSSTTGVTYNAPSTVISSVATVTLTATSIKDPTKSTTATITLNPISVTIGPASPVAMVGGATQAFTATVASDGSNSGVTWTITGGGSFSAGSTASGIATTYTSANPVTTATAVVTATSVKDPSKTASATITLNPITVSFSTVTTGVALDSGQTLALAAIVANDSSASGATFASVGAGTVSPSTAVGNSPATTLTATGAVASTVTVTAASVKDPTKSATTASISVNPAVAITTPAGALAGGTTGTIYAGAAIAATGGSGAKAFAIGSGSLPAGLSISPTTGAITGTPSGTAGTATFTVKVTDSATTPVTVTSGTYTIDIIAAPLVWVSPTTGTLTYTVGTPITPITLSTTGGTGTITYSVNSGTLPPGLQIVGNQITGTPNAPTLVSGNVISLLATDSATPTAVTAVSASVTVIANPVALAITSSALPTGTVGAGYSYQLISTGGTGTITWSLSSGSLTGTGLTLSSTGLLSGTPNATQSGLSLTFQAGDSATNQQQTATRTLSLTVTNVLTITTSTSLPNAITSIAYNQTLAAAGGSGSGYTWTVTSGATGTNSLATLNLSVSSSGVVSGTPASSGTANFTAQVKDSSNNTTTASFIVNAYAALALPSPNPSSLGSATTTSSYTGSVTATGGVPGYSWTVNGSGIGSGSVSLGNGTLSASSTGSTLNITGTPTSTGTVTFTASVTDSASNTVGPVTYTIPVSTTYSVGGQISLNNNCGGGSSSVPVMTVTLSQGSTVIQTQTTDSTGNFAFTNIANGTYTVTPSITGPSSVFYPATQSVTVNGSNISSTSFNVALGYTVSGTVAYTGTQTGQIYLSLNPTNSCGSGSTGTSISATGAFTIRGVAPGTYTLQAFMDNLGKGAANAADPTGSTSSVTVAAANLTGQNVTLTDPATVTLSTGPKLSSVNAFNTGALAQFKAITNSSGVEMATSYTLQWSTASSFTTIAGSKTFPANGTHQNVWFVNGLTDGSVYYFRAYGTSAGTATSSYSSIIGPITIGAPTGGNTVSGAVSFAGSATGPLYVGFLDQNTNALYGQYIASPANVEAYSIQVPSGSNYFFVGILDQNNDGVIDTGDINNAGNGNSQTVTVITGPTANENLTLPSAAGIATVNTQSYQSINSSGSSQSYSLNFQVNGLNNQPVAVTLASGPNLINPVDIAVCGGGNSGCGQGFQMSFNINASVPNVGDSYAFNITYSDGTTGTLTATVTAVLNAFATSLAPQTGTSVSITPTFTWTDPINASSYTYQFYMNDSNGNTIWQIPGNNSNSNGFSSSTTSITWGTDPTGSGSTPSVGSLTLGTNYNWQIQVQDNNGNSAVTQVQYQP
jgi:hypothetical protein